MNVSYDVPRIALPGVEIDPEIRKALDAADAHEAFVRNQQRRMAEAMVRLGKPVFRRGKPKRRRKTHVQHMTRRPAPTPDLRSRKIEEAA